MVSFPALARMWLLEDNKSRFPDFFKYRHGDGAGSEITNSRQNRYNAGMGVSFFISTAIHLAVFLLLLATSIFFVTTLFPVKHRIEKNM
jgi:hypothetical protein